jgi:hypothetical protein
LTDLIELGSGPMSRDSWLSAVTVGWFVVGLAGVIVSVRNPRRLGWLFCGHVCLLEYYFECFSLVDQSLYIP